MTAHGFRYSFTTPHRGTFHLSLTVLVHYRSPGRILAWQVVLPDSHGIPRAPCYSGTCPHLTGNFVYGTLTHSGTASQRLRLPPASVPWAGRPRQTHPTTPHTQRLPSLPRARFSLFPVRSPLLGESLLFTLPTGTEMFHFPASPPTALYIQTAATRHNSG